MDFLFKYKLVQFSEGELGFQYGQPWLVVLLLVLTIGTLLLVYRASSRYPGRGFKWTSFGLKAGALGLIIFPLFEPVLVTPDVVTDENFVAVLIDQSESMNLPDGGDGRSRLEAARSAMTRVGPDIETYFDVRYYGFSSDATRLDSIPGTTMVNGSKTNLAAALNRVLDDFQGLPLSGVVILTDGADNSTEVPRNQAALFRQRGIPLHIVGFGQERFERDREILEVLTSRGVEETTGAEIDVKLRSWGRETEPVAVNLYRAGQLVHSESFRLKGDGKVDQYTLFYEPDQPGAAEYTVELATDPDETNKINNRLRTLIDTRRDSLRVLYFEGHLRRDFKFIKRALEEDRTITFTSVARTGIGKYYRQGIRSAEELAGGFPSSETDLFAFDAILFGDIEASAFTPDQLSLVEQFVKRRGGGFAMLGGRNSFAEGDFWNTPIAQALPVEIDPSRKAAIPPDFSKADRPPREQGFHFEPTPAGLESSILKLSPQPDSNRTRWNNLPGLTSINYLGPVKPGATVLAEKPEDEFGDTEPLLVTQRYGRGRSAALATASTWRWQMLENDEDMRHERFWRQLVRWLVASAPDPVNIEAETNPFVAGEESPLAVTVFDEQFNAVSDAIVTGTLTDSIGTATTVVFQPGLTGRGLYQSHFVPGHEGVYQLSVSATRNGLAAGSDLSHVLVRHPGREYYDASLKKPLLMDLARESDGLYYDADELSSLPDNLRFKKTSTSIFQADLIWDMPFLFLLALVLLSIEWILRRRFGLA